MITIGWSYVYKRGVTGSNPVAPTNSVLRNYIPIFKCYFGESAGEPDVIGFLGAWWPIGSGSSLAASEARPARPSDELLSQSASTSGELAS